LNLAIDLHPIAKSANNRNSMSGLLKVFKNIGKASGDNLAKAATQKSSDIVNQTGDNWNSSTAPTSTQIQMAAQVLLNNGQRMPRIGLGTYGVKDKSTCLKVFNEAISVGYRLFDTGTLYGNDEYIGDVVYDRLSSQELKRDDIFIETKIAPWQHGKQNTNKAVADSLKRLKLSYIDMVLVHWPGVAKASPNDPKNKEMRAETWKELENLVSEGKIKSIGVSNYTESHLNDLLSYCKVKPTVNQVEFHPMCYQKQLLQFCKSNSIYLQAYSSLGSSQSNPPGWTVLFNNEHVKSIASKHGRTIPQVLLRWGLQHDCLLIPKTSKVENLKPNLDIMGFQLDNEDMQKLNELNQDKHFCWNPAQIA
jgi:diketogulonate reductase-like aldo/keto reductase